MARPLRLLQLDDVNPALVKYYNFDQQRKVGRCTKILATCPLCGKQKWQPLCYVRSGVSPFCQGCAKVKKLKPHEVSVDLRPFIKFETAKKVRGRWKVLVKCPHCKQERWVTIPALRIKRNTGIRCPKCAASQRGKLARINKQGYTRLLISKLLAKDKVLAHAMAGADRFHILEHRLVMARYLGRPLKSSEHVHHRNGDKTDNRLANLRLVARDAHCKAPADQIARLVVEIEHLARTLKCCGIDSPPLLSRFLERLGQLQPQFQENKQAPST